MHAWDDEGEPLVLWKKEHGTALTLSQSFRFGPRLADEVNGWLAIVDASGVAPRPWAWAERVHLSRSVGVGRCDRDLAWPAGLWSAWKRSLRQFLLLPLVCLEARRYAPFVLRAGGRAT